MADFLRFKGARSVTKQTGDEMVLRQPPKGGSTFQTKRWWGGKGTVVYVSAAIFKVESSAGDLQLVIPTDNETTATNIRHDGAGNFTFSDYRAIDRIAVYNADRSVLYTEYQFPRISGGSVLKRTVNALPQGVAFTGNCTVSGAAKEGEVLTATPAPFSGGLGSVSTTIRWQSRASGGSQWNNVQTQTSPPYTYTIQSSNVGSQMRAQTRVSDDTGTVVKNSSPTGEISAADVLFSDLEAAAAQTFAVTVANSVFELDGVAQDTITASANDILIFDQSDASNATHPLRIYTDSSKATEVTVGVTIDGDKLAFQPPITGSFVYACANHAGMGGDITIS